MTNIFLSPGLESQTGLAATERYSNQTIQDCGSIESIPEQLPSAQWPFCIPIWNSNLGEVTKSAYIWDELTNESIYIQDLWAKEIEFWHVTFSSSTTNHNTIGGVDKVAPVQCKAYIHSLEKEFKGYPLSSIALDKFRNGDLLDGVLIAPYKEGEVNKELSVISKKTTEPFNFTSFITTKHIDLVTNLQPENSHYLTAVEIKPLANTVGETEIEFFDSLFKEINHVDDIPKLLFVFDRVSKAGLLFQSANKLFEADLLDIETIEKNDIGVHSDAGALNQSYSNQLNGVLNDKFPKLLKSDFVLHQGLKSSLFICKKLGIYTHGYDKDLIDPIFRYYVHRIFTAIKSGLNCSDEQKSIFEKYSSKWESEGRNFIEFDVIST